MPSRNTTSRQQLEGIKGWVSIDIRQCAQQIDQQSALQTSQKEKNDRIPCWSVLKSDDQSGALKSARLQCTTPPLINLVPLKKGNAGDEFYPSFTTLYLWVLFFWHWSIDFLLGLMFKPTIRPEQIKQLVLFRNYQLFQNSRENGCMVDFGHFSVESGIRIFHLIFCWYHLRFWFFLCWTLFNLRKES